MSEKLQKVLARCGHGSRRQIEVMIHSGRITIDDRIAQLGDRIEPSPTIKIRIDDHFVSINKFKKVQNRVLIYHKSEGEICSNSDPQGRPTVFKNLPKVCSARWVAVGRLDINTSGLLLFTTDGELANRLMHPRRKLEREYAVRVFGQSDDKSFKKLKSCICLEDGPACFRTIDFQGGEGLNRWYKVTLNEGRNREVRRMWEAVGFQVSRLIRIRYGDILLPRRLPRSGWCELDLRSINRLRTSVDLKPETV